MVQLNVLLLKTCKFSHFLTCPMQAIGGGSDPYAIRAHMTRSSVPIVHYTKNIRRSADSARSAESNHIHFVGGLYVKFS